MRYSQLFIPTVKEIPAEAEIPSHQLMIRAGFIRKVASGTYTYLPLGKKMLAKVENIVREEMNATGAQEILMPILQPMELWAKTGRDVDYGETMCRFTDRHGRENVLAPTAEEVVTTLIAGEVRSYKQLPINLYQIATKFRDEFRPRFGVLRSREFLMKDAYSFDVDLEGLEKSYQKMYDAYCRIFNRCGLKYVVVEAESGPIGGSVSHEFMVPCQNGEDIIVHTEDFSYAANIEKAKVDPVPIDEAKRQAASQAPAPQEVYTPNAGTIEQVCALLKTTPQEMIKTLICTAADGKTIVAVIRGDHELNMAKLKSAAEVERIELADDETVLKVSQAITGFAGPMDMAERADKLIIDYAVAAMPIGVAGANKTDYHVRNIVPGRDFPLEGENVIVADIRNAVEGDTYQGKPLLFSHGIEVGHVFKLATKYSEKLGAVVLDETGTERPCVMGCYGIGINRIIAAAIETGHDEAGCIFPITIAPFEVIILILNNDEAEVVAASEKIYDELRDKGIDVLLDDRDVRAGMKFKDADLLGIPVRIAIGKKGMEEKTAEIKRRSDDKPTKVPIEQTVAFTIKIVEQLKAELQ